jgi:hypothetical protein
MQRLKRSAIIEALYHDHNTERWLGKSADQSGDDWAVEAGLTVFQAASGNGVFGTAIKVIGPDDTPLQSGYDEFDLHSMLVVDSSSQTAYVIRFIFGTGNDAEVEEAAGRYSDVMYIKESAAGRGSPIDLKMPPHASGTKHWVKIKNVTNSATLDFYVGLHEYQPH